MTSVGFRTSTANQHAICHFEETPTVSNRGLVGDDSRCNCASDDRTDICSQILASSLPVERVVAERGSSNDGVKS
jgi:hypothetical protein